MKYSKPEVVVLGSALDFVQSVNKPNPNIHDTFKDLTASAYEADE
ncbi:MAG: hypothetical protein ACLPND_23760 [Candidatus Korobacteraceae bacterium]